MKRFYVTKTWDNWPEGGSCGEVIEAETDEEAEAKMDLVMASYREEFAFCIHCGEDNEPDSEEGYCADCSERIDAGEKLGETDAANKRIVEEMGDQWHTVDCFDLDDFIRQHAPTDDT